MWNIRTGKYTGPGKVIRNNYLVRVVDVGPGSNVRYYVWFKGTHPRAREWSEDWRAAFRGQRIPAWDNELSYLIDRFGFESRYGNGVHYTGFSRGAPLAMYMGGVGYGLGKNPFSAYPPAEGSSWHFSREPFHDIVLTPITNIESFLTPQASQSAMSDTSLAIGYRNTYGEPVGDEWNLDRHPTAGWKDYSKDDMNRYYKTAIVSSGNSGIHKDPRSPTGYIALDSHGKWHIYSIGPSGQEYLGDEFSPKRPAEDELPVVDDSSQNTCPIQPSFGSGFSGLVTTFLDPVTSRIIGYKGIPRKRKFSTLQRYSPFWKEQMRLTQTSVLAGPS